MTEIQILREKCDAAFAENEQLRIEIKANVEEIKSLDERIRELRIDNASLVSEALTNDIPHCENQCGILRPDNAIEAMEKIIEARKLMLVDERKALYKVMFASAHAHKAIGSTSRSLDPRAKELLNNKGSINMKVKAKTTFISLETFWNFSDLKIGDCFIYPTMSDFNTHWFIKTGEKEIFIPLTLVFKDGDRFVNIVRDNTKMSKQVKDLKVGEVIELIDYPEVRMVLAIKRDDERGVYAYCLEGIFAKPLIGERMERFAALWNGFEQFSKEKIALARRMALDKLGEESDEIKDEIKKKTTATGESA